VESTYLKTVTVDEQQLKIVWLRSNEDDFGHYEIYKNKRGKGELVYLTSIFNIEDTVYYDTDVDINNQSYCYEIRVSDNCGHLSRFSNIGCSIVLRGDSKDAGPEVKPRFFFDLYWDEYLSWKGEVEAYELKRSVDTGALRPIVRTDYNIREYRDADLDFDWGGYWFNVEAIEGPGSLDATSKSNKIYLIQPPLVFVPNAVTSNGDQLNDVFGWSDVFVKEFEMCIYNRWGEKIFETTDKNKEWDGDYRKPGLKNTDVYVWVVTYKGWDNRRYIKKGTVTILR
jgi:gliding motility-associated-like protein